MKKILFYSLLSSSKNESYSFRLRTFTLSIIYPINTKSEISVRNSSKSLKLLKYNSHLASSSVLLTYQLICKSGSSEVSMNDLILIILFIIPIFYVSL